MVHRIYPTELQLNRENSSDTKTSFLDLNLCWFLCFRFDALTELGAFMRTEFLCISILRVASGPRVQLASYKSALNPTPPPPPPPGGLLYQPF